MTPGGRGVGTRDTADHGMLTRSVVVVVVVVVAVVVALLVWGA